MPWLWTLSILLITTVFVIRISRKKSLKLLAVYFLAVFSALLIVEIYLYIKMTPQHIVTSGNITTDGYQIKDNVLGYRPIKGIKRNILKQIDNDTIYNVSYSINNDGLRITSSSNKSGLKNIIFFGGSFTFGEGVNDNETLPYYIGLAANHKFTIHNFGFHGYGPHQMLAALQNNVYENIVDTSKESIVIYSFNPDHVRRSCGKAPWDFHGPKYEIKNKELFYIGNFDSNSITSNIVIRRIIQQLSKSLLFRSLFVDSSKITYEDEKLFSKIIKKSILVLSNKYIISRFIILVWSSHDTTLLDQQRMSTRLFPKDYKNNIEIYDVSNLLQNYDNYKNIYAISKYDLHPNAKAYKELATVLFDIIK